MTELEPGAIGASPENFLDDVLLWRPPLPVDRADFSGLFELETDLAKLADAPGYAWERLPRWITEIEDTFRRTAEIPIVCIDLCSSTPLNAQMLRALEFKRSGERARELTRSLFGNELDAELEDDDLRAVHNVATTDQASRQLLESAVQAVLYTRNSYDMADGDADIAIERLSARFREVIPDQSVRYDMEQGGRTLETRWGICFTSAQQDYTYLESLANLDRLTPRAQELGRQFPELMTATTARITAQYKAELEELARNGGLVSEPAIELSKRRQKQFQQEIDGRAYEILEADREATKETEPVGTELAQRYLDWQIGK